MKPFFIKTSANFFIFCLEQPNRVPNWVNVNCFSDCLTIDSSINCFNDISGICLSKSVCSLFPAINNVLKIAFCWFSAVFENLAIKSLKFMESSLSISNLLRVLIIATSY